MNTEPIKLYTSLFLLSILALPGTLPAQTCNTCVPCQPPPAVRTVLVPQVITEYQTKSVTRYRPETRERMVTVYREVPATETVEEEYTVMVPETRVRTVADKIQHPVYGDIQLRTTKLTPEVEVRRGTQTVSRLVPVQEERCVSDCCSTATATAVLPPVPGEVDANPPPPPRGGSTIAPSAASSACCNPCTSRKVCVTSWKPVSEQVSVDYPVTQLRPDSRLDTVSFYEYRTETRLREESYVVDVPEQRLRTREVAVTRSVPEQRLQQYTEWVPYQQRVQVPVVTRRYVEQPVIVR